MSGVYGIPRLRPRSTFTVAMRLYRVWTSAMSSLCTGVCQAERDQYYRRLLTGRACEHYLGEAPARELMFEARANVPVASGEAVILLERPVALDIASVGHVTVKREGSLFDFALDRSVHGYSAFEIEGAFVVVDFGSRLLKEELDAGVALTVVECVALPTAGNIRDQHFGRQHRRVCIGRTLIGRILGRSESGEWQSQYGRQ